MEYVTCNLCGSTEAVPLYQVRDLFLNRADTSAMLVQCSRCGLIYQNPRPTLDEMAAYYPPEYELYAKPSESQSWLMRRAVQYGMAKRCRPLVRRKRSGRLLDVGCATGTFLAAMRDYPGWDVMGVEISEHAARSAREQHGLNVLTGTLEQARLPDQHFDAVTLWDVAEHLHDPAASLREIGRILKPDGLLLLRVPNAASWDAHVFGSYWAGLDAPRHLYVFSQRTLTKLLQANGFDMLDAGCWIGSYVTSVLSVRYWLTARSFTGRAAGTLVKLLYHPVMRVATVPPFWVIDRMGRGSLLTALAAPSGEAGPC